MSAPAPKKDPNVSFLQGVLKAAKNWSEEERQLFRDLFCRPASQEDICRKRGWTTEKFNSEQKRLLQLCMSGSVN